ncbi:MAG: ATP-dependent DNA helicase RecG [bacterium]|nr:ATP-dependent DNA helicase RecG [bacterium]MCM1375720.1 ATP-dependent DNA helicase RecG [Muribaculum sp.]
MEDGTSILELKGIGEKTQKLFAKVNIFTVGDLLHHYPRDYETFREPEPIAKLKVGEVCTIQAAVCGTVNVKKVRSLTILNVLVQDASGGLMLTFFNMPFLKNVLKPGSSHIFRGRVQSKGAALTMEQPRLFKQEEYARLLAFIQPRYALTKGLTNQMVQKAVKQALTHYCFGCDPYPERLRRQYDLMERQEAMHSIHFPTDYEEMVRARRRVVFEEFFSFLYLLRENREQCRLLENEYRMIETADMGRLLERLPYRLTEAQLRTWQEVCQDMSSPWCMNRLVQGDVGSGKTIIAVLALLMCVSNGYQGAMMAPTEVLAAQHYEGVCEYVRRYGVALRPVLLVGSMTARQKREAYEKISSGEVNLVIGTHAVIQDKVHFQKLALVVTDEQHRFGVRQREILAEKGANPHVLVMSATPIPRTLAIILYGDLKVSVIDELPTGRLPIKNCVVGTSYRPSAYRFIEKEVRAGRQAYVICPMVEEGEMDELENVADYADKLRAALPADIRVATLHGKMRPADKNRIMEEYGTHNIDVLVSTTVIEVGINVPNATVMMVENAERFGLAQLHQLRGRVGRGEHQSYCIFVSAQDNRETMERLEILNRSNDGFFIASEDLKLRGPGDLFGIRQSGALTFQMGDIYTDAEILKQASQAVEEVSAAQDGEYRQLLEYLHREKRLQVDFRTI